MAAYDLSRPMIRWGAGFGNTLRFGYPLDNVTTGDEPRAGSDTLQVPSGVEDAWTVATDYVLVAQLRYIPRVDTTVPIATGWDGATGVREFLRWARDKNLLRFYPDATDSTTHIDCYLADPMAGQPTPETDGTRNLQVKLRNPTTPYDGYGS